MDPAGPQDDGAREVFPVQFYRDTAEAIAGSTDMKDFRPNAVAVKEEEDVEPITHTFNAEPGEPGAAPAEDEPEFEEEPLSILDDSPPVDDPEPEPQPDAEPEEEPTDPEVHDDDG